MDGTLNNEHCYRKRNQRIRRQKLHDNREKAMSTTATNCTATTIMGATLSYARYEVNLVSCGEGRKNDNIGNGWCEHQPKTNHKKPMQAKLAASKGYGA